MMWAFDLKSEHQKLLQQIQHTSEVQAASSKALEVITRDLSTSHTALHEEVRSLKDNNLQLLSQDITEIERSSELKIQKIDRRMTMLETDQRELLGALDRVAQAEDALQRQRQEVARWKEQWDQITTQTNERHRQEINDLRARIEQPAFATQNQVKSKHFMLRNTG